VFYLKYDKPLIAGLIGALATIPYEIITRIFVFMGLGKYSVYQLSSLVITLNRPSSIIGLIITYIIGASISILFYYATKKLGLDYLIPKGVITGLIAWVLMETIFVWLIEGPRLIDPRPLNDYGIHIIGSTLFGGTLGFLFQINLFRINPYSK
jgi:ABC-type uncharacterized transport system permease subunit